MATPSSRGVLERASSSTALGESVSEKRKTLKTLACLWIPLLVSTVVLVGWPLTSRTPLARSNVFAAFLGLFFECPCHHRPSIFSPVKQHVLGLVGIHSFRADSDKRDWIRRTWMSSASKLAPGLTFKFVLHRNGNSASDAAILNETKTHGDLLLLDGIEEEVSSSKKTLDYLQLAFSLYDAKFYVKMNHDVYLYPNRLASLLSRGRLGTRTYLGCMIRQQVIKNPQEKGFEPQYQLLGSHHMLHAAGPIYALSQVVVADLVNQAQYGLRMLNGEDKSVGLWLLAFNVEYEDDRNLCSNECTQNSIAVYKTSQCSDSCGSDIDMQVLYSNKTCR